MTDPTAIRAILASPTFFLTAERQRERKRLADWALTATAGIKTWVWSLAARLARTWERNPNHESGAHTKERWARERQLAMDSKTLERHGHYLVCKCLPVRERTRARILSDTVHAVMATGDWWKPRRYVDRTTGEVRETLYLPEDTWSAQTLIAYCVAILERLHALVPLVTERVTPRYKPLTTDNPSGGRKPSSRDSDLTATLTRLREKYGGPQPDLPATS